MGLFKKSCYTSGPAPQAVQPNPDNFQIATLTQVGDLWVAEVRYPGCTNYEGRKVLLLRANPSRLKRLDPHFTPGGIVVARFEPTIEGWQMAIDTAKAR